MRVSALLLLLLHSRARPPLGTAAQVFGKQGAYMCILEEQRGMSVADFRRMADSQQKPSKGARPPPNTRWPRPRCSTARPPLTRAVERGVDCDAAPERALKQLVVAVACGWVGWCGGGAVEEGE